MNGVAAGSGAGRGKYRILTSCSSPVNFTLTAFPTGPNEEELTIEEEARDLDFVLFTQSEPTENCRVQVQQH